MSQIFEMITFPLKVPLSLWHERASSNASTTTSVPANDSKSPKWSLTGFFQSIKSRLTNTKSEDIPEDILYAPYGCTAACQGDGKPITAAHALHSHARGSLWMSRDNEFERWDTKGGKVQVRLTTGSGQIATPYGVTHERFAEQCSTFEFSPGILSKVRAKRPFFDYNVQYFGETPEYLEFAFAAYDVGAFLVLCRYHLFDRTVKAIIAVKSEDQLTSAGFTIDAIKGWLKNEASIINAEPLALVPIIMSLIQHHGRAAVRWRTALYFEEGRLGVTRRREFLESLKYPEISYDYELLTAHLASLGRDLADTKMSANTIKLYINAFQNALSKVMPKQGGNKEGRFRLDQEIDGVIARADALLIHMDANQSILDGLETVLYNRTNQHGTSIMMSIAVIGLIFLPATLVSAVFASGVFQLHEGGASLIQPSGSHPTSPPTLVSKHLPLFLFVCIGLTLGTISCWILWCRFGIRWINKLRESRLRKPWPELGQIPREGKLRKKQLDASKGSRCYQLHSKALEEGIATCSLSAGSPCLDGYCGHKLDRAETSG